MIGTSVLWVGYLSPYLSLLGLVCFRRYASLYALSLSAHAFGPPRSLAVLGPFGIVETAAFDFAVLESGCFGMFWKSAFWKSGPEFGVLVSLGVSAQFSCTTVLAAPNSLIGTGCQKGWANHQAPARPSRAMTMKLQVQGRFASYGSCTPRD
jgi:hypothetical protein